MVVLHSLQKPPSSQQSFPLAYFDRDYKSIETFQQQLSSLFTLLFLLSTGQIRSLARILNCLLARMFEMEFDAIQYDPIRYDKDVGNLRHDPVEVDSCWSGAPNCTHERA